MHDSVFIFFFKQKTAYEMRISDWSSDVCSSDLISLGTWSGGWRIMRTLGRRIIHLDPPRGFAAESVAASVLYTTAYVYEAPISTTHTITSAVMGVGATKRLSAVRWGVAKSIITAWVLPFPAAGAMAAGSYFVCHFLLAVRIGRAH